MLICIVIVFLLCWGPRFIMELLMKMQFSWLYYQHVYVIRTVLFLLPMVHAILNPMIYFIMSRNFRNSVVKKCANGCCENGPQGSFEDLEMKHNNTVRNFAVYAGLKDYIFYYYRVSHISINAFKKFAGSFEIKGQLISKQNCRAVTFPMDSG